MSNLKNQNIISIKNEDESTIISLTKHGKKIINMNLIDQINSYELDTIKNQLITILYLPLKKLIKLTYYNYSDNSNSSSNGKNLVIHLYDWSKFGIKNIWCEYHETLILKIIQMIKIKQKRELFNISDKRNKLNSSEISVASDFTFLNLFFKDSQVLFCETKIEGKNYIFNRWIILEAINFYNVIFNCSPSVEDISELCFIDYIKIEKRISELLFLYSNQLSKNISKFFLIIKSSPLSRKLVIKLFNKFNQFKLNITDPNSKPIRKLLIEFNEFIENNLEKLIRNEKIVYSSETAQGSLNDCEEILTQNKIYQFIYDPMKTFKTEIKENLRKWRENVLRNDLNELTKAGILRTTKIGRNYLFELNYHDFYDEKLNTYFSLIAPDIIIEKYNKYKTNFNF